MEDVARRGWRQGCCLPPNLLAELKKDCATTIHVVVSHDCDLVHLDLPSEPSAEILPAALLDDAKADGGLSHGKNPRKLQFLATSHGEDALYEAQAHERYFIPRDLLTRHDPHPDHRLRSESLLLIRRWLANRYVRSAFPDAFNERAQAKKEIIRKALAKHGHAISAIYLLIEDRELPQEESYKIVLRATLPGDAFQNTATRTEAQRGFDKLAAALGQCAGIDVQEASLVSEADVTLDDLRVLKRWDFDYLSLREEAPGSLPPTSE